MRRRRLIAATILLSIPCFSTPADSAEQAADVNDELCGDNAIWSSYEPPPRFDNDKLENTSISAKLTSTDIVV